MRIAFIEKMAAQTMASKKCCRNSALKRLTIVFGMLGLIFGGIAMFAPIDGMMLSRRSSEVPLVFILWALFFGLSLLAAACSFSMDKE